MKIAILTLFLGLISIPTWLRRLYKYRYRYRYKYRHKYKFRYKYKGTWAWSFIHAVAQSALADNVVISCFLYKLF